MSRPRRIILLLVLLTLVVYWPVGGDRFVNYDDGDYVVDNEMVNHGLSGKGVAWAFTTFHANNWHPLTWISHMVDCSLFGLNPGGHHLVNVLFHAANAALVFLVLLRLTKAQWASAVVAGLFAWHPMHVESVAWVAERKDVLSTFFALLALWHYARYAQEGRRLNYWAAAACFGLGILAKPMVVTLPCVLLLLDYWPLQRIGGEKGWAGWWRLAAEKWPFFLLTAGSCALTYLAQSRVVEHAAAVASLGWVSLPYRLKNIPVGYVSYVETLLWPTKLAIFYPLREVISPALVAGSLAVLGGISAWCVRGWRSRPYWLVGWLWFLGTLVPVIGLVQVGGAAFADRYSYFPSIGLFIMLVFAVEEWLQRRPTARWGASVGAACLLAGYLVGTERQLGFWQNSETLFRHDLAVATDNDVARNNLANTLETQGRLPEALVEYQAAVQLAPKRYFLHNNVADVLVKLGRYSEAVEAYRTAIDLRSDEPGVHDGLGDALAHLGRYEEALPEFAVAEKLDPTLPWPHMNLARAYLKLGRDAEAVTEMRAALRLAPNDYHVLLESARLLACNAHAAGRDGKAAWQLATQANLLSGQSQPAVFDVLGLAAAENGDFVAAQAMATQALALCAAQQLKGTEQINRRIEAYQQHQPWRESFEDTNRSVPAPAKP